jgi:hypothetical protein
LGNLKQWRLRTHTNKQVNLSFCNIVSPANFEVKTCQDIWKVWGVACGWLRVTHMSGWKWGIGLAAAALGAPTLYVCTIIYKTTCIYDYHIYLYIYIYMYLIGNRKYTICTGFWVYIGPTSATHGPGPGVFSPLEGRRSWLRCQGPQFLDDLSGIIVPQSDGLRFEIWEWIDYK